MTLDDASPARARSRSLSRLRSLAASGGVATPRSPSVAPAEDFSPRQSPRASASWDGNNDASAPATPQESRPGVASSPSWEQESARAEEARALLLEMQRLQAAQKAEMDALLASHGRLLGTIAQAPSGDKEDEAFDESPGMAARSPSELRGRRGRSASARRSGAANESPVARMRSASPAPRPSSTDTEQSQMEGSQGRSAGTRSASLGPRPDTKKKHAVFPRTGPKEKPASDWRALLPSEAGGSGVSDEEDDIFEDDIPPPPPRQTSQKRAVEKGTVGRRGASMPPRKPLRDAGISQASRPFDELPFDENTTDTVLSDMEGAGHGKRAGRRGHSVAATRKKETMEVASAGSASPMARMRSASLGPRTPPPRPPPSSVRTSKPVPSDPILGPRDTGRRGPEQVLREREPGVYEVSPAETPATSQAKQDDDAPPSEVVAVTRRAVAKPVEGTFNASHSPMARWRGRSLSPGRMQDEKNSAQPPSPRPRPVRRGMRSASPAPRPPRGHPAVPRSPKLDLAGLRGRVLSARRTTHKPAEEARPEARPEVPPCLRSSSYEVPDDEGGDVPTKHRSRASPRGRASSVPPPSSLARRVTFKDEEDVLGDAPLRKNAKKEKKSPTLLRREKKEREPAEAKNDHAPPFLGESAIHTPEPRRERKAPAPTPRREAARKETPALDRAVKAASVRCASPIARMRNARSASPAPRGRNGYLSPAARKAALRAQDVAKGAPAGEGRHARNDSDKTIAPVKISVRDYAACGAAKVNVDSGKDADDGSVDSSFELEMGPTASELKIVERSRGKEVAEVVRLSESDAGKTKPRRRAHRRSVSMDSLLGGLMGAHDDKEGRENGDGDRAKASIPKPKSRKGLRHRPPLFPKAAARPEIGKAFSFSSFSAGHGEGAPPGPSPEEHSEGALDLSSLVVVGTDDRPQESPQESSPSRRSEGSSDSPTGIGELLEFQNKHAAPYCPRLPFGAKYRCAVVEEEGAADAFEVELIADEEGKVVEDVAIPRVLDFDDASVYSI
ncbi:hypothetical protein ACHAXT_009126 [Thalassiosira profunda]